VKCEASRNLKWSISNTGIQVSSSGGSGGKCAEGADRRVVASPSRVYQNPIYKLTLPNPDIPQQDQPLFQVSKPNPNAGWWTLFYFTCVSSVDQFVVLARALRSTLYDAVWTAMPDISSHLNELNSGGFKKIRRSRGEGHVFR
jgi:hypothetical protein